MSGVKRVPARDGLEDVDWQRPDLIFTVSHAIMHLVPFFFLCCPSGPCFFFPLDEYESLRPVSDYTSVMYPSLVRQARVAMIRPADLDGVSWGGGGPMAVRSRSSPTGETKGGAVCAS